MSGEIEKERVDADASTLIPQILSAGLRCQNSLEWLEWDW